MTMIDDDLAMIPESVRQAYQGKAFLETPALAKALGMHVDTIRSYVKSGDLPARQKGRGVKRPRLVFALEDVGFLCRRMYMSRIRQSGVRQNGEPSGCEKVTPIRPRKKR